MADSIRIPYKLFERYREKICCSQLAEYFMNDKEKPPFRTDAHAFRHEGDNYITTAATYGCLSNESIEVYKLIPIHLWDKHTKRRPVHDQLGYREGLIVTLHNIEYVLSEQIKLKTYLPESVYGLTEAEVMQHHHENMKYGWRASMRKPIYFSQKNIHYMTYEYDNEHKFADLTVLHYRKNNGEIQTVRIKNPDIIAELLPVAREAILLDTDQIQLF